MDYDERIEIALLNSIYIIGVVAFFLLAVYKSPISLNPIYIAFGFGFTVTIFYYLIKKFFPKGDIYIFLILSFLTEIGLIMIYRINSELALKQVEWIAIGMILFMASIFFFRFYEGIRKHYQVLLVLIILLFLVTLLFGTEKFGSKNWIVVGNFSFQPSELIKILFVMMVSEILTRDKTKKGILKVVGITLISLFFLVLQKDLGSAFLFYMTALIMIFVATSNLLYTMFGFLGLIFSGYMGFILFDHVKVRVAAWLNPWLDVPGRSYQIVQSLFAIGYGGFFGTGLGLGHPEYIPAVYTDFIFSAICEEFGFLGAVAIVIVYFIICYRGLRVSLKCREEVYSYIALGLISMFGLQVFTIIGGVIKLIPLTGVTLPFVSYGGTSMVMSFITFGIIKYISELGVEDLWEKENEIYKLS